MGNLRGYEWLILLLIVLLLFGAKRLPDTARGLGRSLRIFKAETKGLRDDEKADEAGTTVHAVPVEPRHIAPSPTPPTTPPVAGETPVVQPVVQPVRQAGTDASER